MLGRRARHGRVWLEGIMSIIDSDEKRASVINGALQAAAEARQPPQNMPVVLETVPEVDADEATKAGIALDMSTDINARTVVKRANLRTTLGKHFMQQGVLEQAVGVCVMSLDHGEAALRMLREVADDPHGTENKSADEVKVAALTQIPKVMAAMKGLVDTTISAHKIKNAPEKSEGKKRRWSSRPPIDMQPASQEQKTPTQDVPGPGSAPEPVDLRPEEPDSAGASSGP